VKEVRQIPAGGDFDRKDSRPRPRRNPSGSPFTLAPIRSERSSVSETPPRGLVVVRSPPTPGGSGIAGALEAAPAFCALVAPLVALGGIRAVSAAASVLGGTPCGHFDCRRIVLTIGPVQDSRSLRNADVTERLGQVADVILGHDDGVLLLGSGLSLPTAVGTPHWPPQSTPHRRQ